MYNGARRAKAIVVVLESAVKYRTRLAAPAAGPRRQSTATAVPSAKFEPVDAVVQRAQERSVPEALETDHGTESQDNQGLRDEPVRLHCQRIWYCRER